ncbi:unnamed protein product [Durusdinium trenchii]|uniref:Right handed beta helix domain-containing protein n=2 Tax=Durusdinium trenchii TaxID=1381693 RepID=A0ABP0HZU2_9DINO
MAPPGVVLAFLCHFILIRLARAARPSVAQSVFLAEDPQDDLEERFRRLIGKNVPHQDSDRERSVEKSYLCKRNSPDLMLPLSMWLASALKDQPPSFQAQKRQEDKEAPSAKTFGSSKGDIQQQQDIAHQLDESCGGGTLHLNRGLYHVPKAGVELGESCALIAAAGTRIQLDGPIMAHNLTLHGDLLFFATRSFGKACLHLTHTLSVLGTVVIENCDNLEESGGGGAARGLRIAPTANLTIRNCSAKSTGGGFDCGDKGLRLDGILEFHQCTAQLQGGGLMLRSGAITLTHHGKLEFHSCSVGRKVLTETQWWKNTWELTGTGGAMAIEDGHASFEGKVLVEGCEAKTGGGLFLNRGHLVQSRGDWRMKNCKAHDSGGCLMLQQSSLTQTAGKISLTWCKARSGGGLAALSGQLDQKGEGRLFLNHCYASGGRGGGVAWHGEFTIRGHVIVKKCAAQKGGGLYMAGHLKQFEGLFKFEECVSERVGGGLILNGTLTQLGGTFTFKKCKSVRKKELPSGGGGVWIESGEMSQQGGTMTFSLCSTPGHGGGLGVQAGSIKQEGGLLQLHTCQASKLGGGIYAKGNIIQTNGTLKVTSCVSSWGGGGVWVAGELTQHGGSILLMKCNSSGYGGGLAVRSGRIQQLGGLLEVSACNSRDASGGGIYLEGNLTQIDGTLKTNACHASGGGGVWVQSGDVNQHGGAMFFAECKAAGYGGGLGVLGSLRRTGGMMDLEDCAAKRSGGGIYVNGNVSQSSGTLQLRKCLVSGEVSGNWTMSGGGGVWVESGAVTQHGGSISFTDCDAVDHGGGLAVIGDIEQHGGFLEFYGCLASRGGGGIYVNGNLAQMEGTLELHRCQSRQFLTKEGGDTRWGGGGVWIQSGEINQNGGSMLFNNCTAAGHGGGLGVAGGSINQKGGVLQLDLCETFSAGGGIYVSGNLSQSNGTLKLSSCKSVQHGADEETWGGGGLFLHDGTITQKGGSMSFFACTTVGYGGGLAMIGGLEQNGGLLDFEDCEAKDSGGGIFIHGNLSQREGTLKLNRCKSVEGLGSDEVTSGGGGVWVQSGEVNQQGGAMSFAHCKTSGNGGGLGAIGGIRQEGGLFDFEDCRAHHSGGGIYLEGNLSQMGGSFTLNRCLSVQNRFGEHGWGGGGVWVHHGEVTQHAGTMHLINCTASGSGGGLGVAGQVIQHGGQLKLDRCIAGEAGGGLYISGWLNRVHFSPMPPTGAGWPTIMTTSPEQLVHS